MSSNLNLSLVEIHSLIQQKVNNCNLCGSKRWDLSPDVYNLTLPSPFKSGQTKKIRCMILTCENCGNIHLLNIAVLTETKETEATKGEQESIKKNLQARKTI